MKMDSPPSADWNEYGGISGFADGPALLSDHYARNDVVGE